MPVLPAGCAQAEHGEHVYFFCEMSVTWPEARRACQAAGTDLAIIDDEAENAFVAANLSATSWVGANDIDSEGTFVWITPGTDGFGVAHVSFTAWATFTPDNCGGVFGQQDCVRVDASGKWNDSACEGGCTEGTFAFVCESY